MNSQSPKEKNNSPPTSSQKTKSKKTVIVKKPISHSLSEKFNDTYISTILVPIKPVTKKEDFECKICPKGTLISYKNIKRHLLENETHSNRIPEKDQELHAKLLEKVQNSNRKRQKNQEELDIDHKAYLEFLALCIKSRCSFKQISEIGMGLKKIANERNLNFFQTHGFSEEEISHISRCFGGCLLEELKKDLPSNNYSLCIDNSTIGGKSISLIEARYLKTEIKNDLPETKIFNKVVGVKYLSNSSSGETMYNIVKDKVLDLSPEIRNNLIGLAHDLASSLTSESKGLISYLRDDFKNKYLFDLEDPCHCLNLVIKKSLEELPSDITDFISDIHSHFSKSPQRVAILHQVQEGEDLNPLSLCHYAKTRWLSLGLSLKRLLKIWDSLIKYIGVAKVEDLKNSNKYQKFLSFLQDDLFKTKIIFLSSVINKISSRNINFQNQALEIQEL